MSKEKTPQSGRPLTEGDVTLLKRGDVLVHVPTSQPCDFVGMTATGRGTPLIKNSGGSDFINRFTFIGRPDADGWMAAPEGGWKENPVPGVRVEVRFADGETQDGMLSDFWSANGVDWWKHESQDPSQHIIAFRLPAAKPAPEAAVQAEYEQAKRDFSRMRDDGSLAPDTPPSAGPDAGLASELREDVPTHLDWPINARLAIIASNNQRYQAAAALEAAAERNDRLTQGAAKMNNEVCQVLGKALGYPWFKDDQTNFPGATEEDGVCVGEHVAESIADEAADRIRRAEAQVAALREALIQADLKIRSFPGADQSDVEFIRQALSAIPTPGRE